MKARRRIFTDTLSFVPPGLLLVLLIAAPAHATIRTVFPDGSGPYPTIQSAIQASSTGDIVELANGVFSGSGNRDITFQGKAITVRSQNGAANCRLEVGASPNDEHCGFRFITGEQSTSLLRGITISGGNFAGGGISIQGGASPTIMECVLDGNHSGGYHSDGAGGGIQCLGSARFIDCMIANNSTIPGEGPGGPGGGVYLDGNPVFEHCAFQGNLAGGSQGKGGAVYAAPGSEPVFDRCTFRDNRAWSGAAAYLESGSATFRDCAIADHSTGLNGRGGGIFCSSNDLRLRHCVLSGNGAHLQGGAIHAVSSSPGSKSCTFYGNFTDGEGGGVNLAAGSHARVDRTIIASTSWGGPVACDQTSSVLASCVDLWDNAGGDYPGCLAGQLGINGNISSDPLFCDAANENFRLSTESPCSPVENPSCGLIGALPVGCGPASAVRDQGLAGARGGVRSLSPVMPNPARGQATLRYQVPAAAHTLLTVHDVAGRTIAVLVDGMRPAGKHDALWNGRDDSGRLVPAGVYTCRLRAGRVRDARTIVLTR